MRIAEAASSRATPGEARVPQPKADSAPAEGPFLLRPGWSALTGVYLPGDGMHSPPPRRVVLLHPEIGVALVEPRGQALPDGEENLFLVIGGERIERLFAGRLPVVHIVTDQSDLHRLESLIADAFAAKPRLSLRGGHAWMGPARRNLRGEDVCIRKPVGSAHDPGFDGMLKGDEAERSFGAGLKFNGLTLFWVAVVALFAVTFAVLQALGPP
jgi:hypothetical protein